LLVIPCVDVDAAEGGDPSIESEFEWKATWHVFLLYYMHIEEDK
jgi:hypothetical protein